MASLRAAEVQHSPGVGGGTRPSHFAASSQSGSPEVSTPKSGVSTSRPNAAAVAAFALSRSGLLGHPGPSRPSPPEAPDVARCAPDSGGKAAALEEARAAREAAAAASAKANQLEDKLRAIEAEKAKLQSDVAVMGVQIGALEAAGEEQKRGG